jgi:hypothetical protein
VGFRVDGHTIRWQFRFATAPTSVSIQPQSAINDLGRQYTVPTGAANLSSTLTVGDNLVSTGVRAEFARAGHRDFGGTGVTGSASDGNCPREASRVQTRGDNVAGMRGWLQDDNFAADREKYR